MGSALAYLGAKTTASEPQGVLKPKPVPRGPRPAAAADPSVPRGGLGQAVPVFGADPPADGRGRLRAPLLSSIHPMTARPRVYCNGCVQVFTQKKLEDLELGDAQAQVDEPGLFLAPGRLVNDEGSS